jgi:hypothetical protein
VMSKGVDEYLGSAASSHDAYPRGLRGTTEVRPSSCPVFNLLELRSETTSSPAVANRSPAIDVFNGLIKVRRFPLLPRILAFVATARIRPVMRPKVKTMTRDDEEYYA